MNNLAHNAASLIRESGELATAVIVLVTTVKSVFGHFFPARSAAVVA